MGWIGRWKDGMDWEVEGWDRLGGGRVRWIGRWRDGMDWEVEG